MKLFTYCFYYVVHFKIDAFLIKETELFLGYSCGYAMKKNCIPERGAAVKILATEVSGPGATFLWPHKTFFFSLSFSVLFFFFFFFLHVYFNVLSVLGVPNSPTINYQIS